MWCMLVVLLILFRKSVVQRVCRSALLGKKQQ
jgi:hypothetical protein